MGKRMNSNGDDMARIGRSMPLLQPVTFRGPDRVVIGGPAPAREAPFEVPGHPHVRRFTTEPRPNMPSQRSQRASRATRRATDSRRVLASRGIDGPDGLVADLGHLLTRRGCGAPWCMGGLPMWLAPHALDDPERRCLGHHRWGRRRAMLHRAAAWLIMSVTTRIRADRYTPRRGLCAGWSAPRPDNRTTTARPPSPPRDRPISDRRIRDRG